MKIISRYSLAARLMHWIMAVCFVFMWICGFVMTTLVEDDSPTEELLFSLHISMGVTLIVLLVLRIGIRFARRPPPLPVEIRGIERVGAHVGHALLYALPMTVMAVGWAEVDLGGHGVEWFGITMPQLFPTVTDSDGGPAELAELLHMWLAYTLLAIAILHVAAAAKHRWWDRHDVIYRMSLGRDKRN